MRNPLQDPALQQFSQLMQLWNWQRSPNVTLASKLPPPRWLRNVSLTQASLAAVPPPAVVLPSISLRHVAHLPARPGMTRLVRLRADPGANSNLKSPRLKGPPSNAAETLPPKGRPPPGTPPSARRIRSINTLRSRCFFTKSKRSPTPFICIMTQLSPNMISYFV